MSKLPKSEQFEELAELYKVFGDSTRVKILFELRDNNLCVQDLAKRVGMTQSAISHQLRILKQSDLVRGERDGKLIIYSLADDHIVNILDMGLEHINE